MNETEVLRDWLLNGCVHLVCSFESNGDTVMVCRIRERFPDYHFCTKHCLDRTTMREYYQGLNNLGIEV